MRASGDVYLGKYEGWYCVDDETFWPEKKIVEGRCPTCGRKVEWISEEDWFFRLSAYRDRLIEHYERFPGWVQPRGVYNEMLAFLREGLDDLSVSRTNLEWGVPISDGGVVYVLGEGRYKWFVALRCPCGCGALVQISLLPDAVPRWRLTEHPDGSISLEPSVWRRVGCRSHFFLRRGSVEWCRGARDG